MGDSADEELARRKIALEIVKHEIEKDGPSKVAAALGVAESAVRFWRDGQVPSKRSAQKILDRYRSRLRIYPPRMSRAELIERVMTSDEVAEASERDPRRAAPTPPVEKGEAVASTAPSDPSDARENVVATLTVLRRRLEALGSEGDVPAVARIATAVVTATRLLARISGQLDVTEAQILRSDAWRKLVGMIRDVLQAFPGAAEALDKRMAEYEARA